jgi:hypothetical protein
VDLVMVGVMAGLLPGFIGGWIGGRIAGLVEGAHTERRRGRGATCEALVRPGPPVVHSMSAVGRRLVTHRREIVTAAATGAGWAR